MNSNNNNDLTTQLLNHLTRSEIGRHIDKISYALGSMSRYMLRKKYLNLGTQKLHFACGGVKCKPGQRGVKVMDQSGLYNHWQYICAKQGKDFRANSLSMLISQLLDRNNKVLDVGCGTCGLTLYLLKNGFKVISIDTSDKMLSMGRSLLFKHGFSGEVLRNASISEFSSLNTGSFEQIVCLDVIEHIVDDSAALSELTNMLKAGGRLIMTVPAMPSLYGPKDVELGHYRRYNKERIQRLFLNSSCTIREMRYWNFIGVPVTWIYLKILNKPVNESIRKETGGFIRKIATSFLRVWFAKLENTLKPPTGLTLIFVAVKNR